MSLPTRLERVVRELRWTDFLLDVTGKFLVGLGLGALLASQLLPCAWALITVGLALSVVVKAKYWKQFWA